MVGYYGVRIPPPTCTHSFESIPNFIMRGKDVCIESFKGFYIPSGSPHFACGSTLKGLLCFYLDLSQFICTSITA